MGWGRRVGVSGIHAAHGPSIVSGMGRVGVGTCGLEVHTRRLRTQKGPDRHIHGSGPDRLALLFAVAFVKLFDASLGIDKGRMARIKRMALGARVDVHVLYRRTGIDHVAAGASDGRFCIFRMYGLLHESLPYQKADIFSRFWRTPQERIIDILRCVHKKADFF